MIFANNMLQRQILRLCCMSMFAVAAMLFGSGCGSDPEARAEALNNAVDAGKKGNWQKCEEYALGVLKNNPADPHALLLRAIASEHLGKVDVARESARLAAENAPESYAAQYTYGRLLAMRPDSTKNAIQVLKRALELRPFDQDTLILLGQCCSKINSDDAIRYYLALPDEVRAEPAIQTSMAIYYLDRRDRRRNYQKLVETALGNAYRVEPKNPAIVLNLALYLDHYRHSRKVAVRYYDDYLKLTEGNPELNPTRAQVRARMSKLR